MTVTAVITCAILMIETKGFRPIELIIGTLIAAGRTHQAPHTLDEARRPFNCRDRPFQVALRR